jgi:tripartite-type tricarboxylate transporter receptor subunit TctC
LFGASTAIHNNTRKGGYEMHRSFCTGLTALTLAVAAVLPGKAFAENYPTRPVTIVVPFPAGGTTDILARLIGQKMSEYLKQTFVVENVAGASSMLGAERVARATNDGYTLLLGSSTTFSTNPHLFRQIRYSLDDFAPISVLARLPFAISMNKDIAAKTVQEFVDFAKKQPNGITYGTTGTGGTSHILGEMMQRSLQIPMRQIPYRGSAPAMTDLLSGQIHLYPDAITTSVPLEREGKIKIIAVSSAKRSPAAPEIPTLVEAGYKDLVFENGYFLLAPKGTPEAIVNKLNEAVRFALNSESVQKRLAQDGAVADYQTPADTKKIMQNEKDSMGEIIRSLGIKLNQ